MHFCNSQRRQSSAPSAASSLRRRREDTGCTGSAHVRWRSRTRRRTFTANDLARSPAKSSHVVVAADEWSSVVVTSLLPSIEQRNTNTARLASARCNRRCRAKRPGQAPVGSGRLRKATAATLLFASSAAEAASPWCWRRREHRVGCAKAGSGQVYQASSSLPRTTR